jgi:DNA-binding transcriptional LysR family regulator
MSVGEGPAPRPGVSAPASASDHPSPWAISDHERDHDLLPMTGIYLSHTYLIRCRIRHDLAEHSCINLRLPTAGGLYAGDLKKGSRELRVRVDGQLIFNDPKMTVLAATDALGLACVLEDIVADQVADGRLIRVLTDWRPPFSGYHLYYPSQRQPSAAFALLVEALRYRARP